MGTYIAPAMSRKKIRNLAMAIRSGLGLTDEPFFPIVHFLEIGLPQIEEGFYYEIETISNLPKRYAVTYPEEKKIVIREDVYESAVNNVPRHRFTLTHELGHYIMHRPNKLQLARENSDEKLPAYLNPEWQANTFAGEIMAPPHIIQGMSDNEVAEKCGLSLQASRIQLRNL